MSCGKQWPEEYLRGEIINDTMLGSLTADIWQDLSPEEQVAPPYRIIIGAQGWVFGQVPTEVIRCRDCPGTIRLTADQAAENLLDLPVRTG